MIEDLIHQALAPVFAPMPLIIANENGPRPDELYGTIRIESLRRLPSHVGPVQEVEGEAAGVRKVAAHRVGQLELQAFGAGAYDALDLGVQRMGFEDNVAAFEALGLVFGPVHDIEEIPVLRTQSQFESRAVLTLPFSYTRVVDETAYWIETVEGVATVGGSIATVEISTPYTATIVDNP